MSDSYYDPYASYYGNTDASGQSEDELIAMLYGAGASGASSPGKTAANRLSYLKSFEGLIGVPMTALAGQAGVSQETLPFMSQQRAIYGNNPMYAGIFDLIDQGADPDSALLSAGVKSAEDDPEGYGLVRQAAVDYATEKVRYNQETQKNGASYSMADGSKYKNAPLGGADIYGTASEYDLLGAPTEDQLVQQYVASKAKKSPSAGRSYSVSPGVSAVHPEDAGLVEWKPSRMDQFGAQRAAKDRVTKAKGTQVRSDANTNLMRRIIAAKTLLG